VGDVVGVAGVAEGVASSGVAAPGVVVSDDGGTGPMRVSGLTGALVEASDGLEIVGAGTAVEEAGVAGSAEAASGVRAGGLSDVSGMPWT
jgi:hypothetical protein